MVVCDQIPEIIAYLAPLGLSWGVGVSELASDGLGFDDCRNPDPPSPRCGAVPTTAILEPANPTLPRMNMDTLKGTAWMDR